MAWASPHVIELVMLLRLGTVALRFGRHRERLFRDDRDDLFIGVHSWFDLFAS
jgi:hypothetical protein